MNSAPAHNAPWDILFVGYGDWYLWRWDGFRTRSAQLCRFLARSERCARMFVLNEPIYLRHLQKGFAIPRLDRLRSLPLRGGLRSAEANVSLLDPSRFLVGPARLKRRYTVRVIRRSMQGLARPPILWIANVHKAYLMEEIPASLRVFDAIDDWESVAVFKHLGPRIRSGYETIMERADLIFTVSSHLKDKFQSKARSPNVIHIPNGVDASLFRLPADPPSVRGKARKDTPRLLTYVGVLSERVDLDLIERVARDWPTCRLQLVGPISRAADQRRRALARIPNLEWKGLVHHSRIPEILRSSDVLLIPHTESRLTLSMDPLKMYEYLTTGLPIVSTPVPPTGDYPSLVYVGAGQRFSEQVGNALNEVLRPEADGLWKARIQESTRHHWEKRVGRIEAAIEEGLAAMSLG